MTGLTLREIARALGGEVSGKQVLAPGPGHSPKDRSLSVRLSRQSPTGYIVFSHANDDWKLCRDYVAGKLGLDTNAWKQHAGSNVYPLQGNSAVPRSEVTPAGQARIAQARRIWEESRDAHGTTAEVYLKSRKLELPDGMAVLRFNSLTPWTEDDGNLIYAPCLIAAMRSITTNVITAIQRTRLSPNGAKLGRRMLGAASGAAIKVDCNASVTTGLTIGEGLETVLTARKLDFKPCWAVGSANGIASFPLLSGVEALTVLAENDETNARAIDVVGRRWIEAGAEVTVITPKGGNDLNDAMRRAS